MKTIIASLVMCVCFSANAYCQNDLRFPSNNGIPAPQVNAQPEQYQLTTPPPATEVPAHQGVLDNLLENQGPVVADQQIFLPEPNVDSRTSPEGIQDYAVERVSYEASEDQMRGPAPLEPPANDGKSFIEREREGQSAGSAETPKQKQSLGQLVSKIGMNLAFVLSILCGVVLLAKQFLKTGSIGVNRKSSDEGSFQIQESISLNPRATLHLVQWQSNKILVACDTEGIKSVEILNPPFGQTLKDFENEERELEKKARQISTRDATQRSGAAETEKVKGVDEKIIRLLLKNAARNND